MKLNTMSCIIQRFHYFYKRLLLAKSDHNVLAFHIKYINFFIIYNEQFYIVSRYSRGTLYFSRDSEKTNLYLRHSLQLMHQ